MSVKILFQELWVLGIGWDTAVPELIQERFIRWLSGYKAICQLEIPRYIGVSATWSETSKIIELHAFGDASEKGYGAVVYCRVPDLDNNYKVSLLISKGKVAPLKKLTLPRLELLAALLCARLVNFVINTLQLDKDNVNVFYYSDSMITLGWIKGESSRWKQFVANRVREIQDLTNPASWYHCVGIENPADLVSRGLAGNELVDSWLWWTGPKWLSTSNQEFRDNSEILDCVLEFPPEEKEICLVSVSKCIEPVYDVERCSSFAKILRIIAYILRFIHNCKPESEKITGELSYDELSVSKLKVFSDCQRQHYLSDIHSLKREEPLKKGSVLKQFKPFLDSDGLLRFGGRLERSNLAYEEKHPLILPKCHLTLLMVRALHVRQKHAGVDTMICMLRANYWIIGLRRLAKRVKSECVTCRRQDSQSCGQVCGPLPELRVKESPPFTVTGLDFAGPLYVCDKPGKKLYFLLFTCAVVRAIHLELVESLTVSDCLLAIRRFCARRGTVNVFYSDNAKTFQKTSKLVQGVLGAPIKWKFIAPRSPWWGGWWERLIRSVKSALKKSLGLKILSRVELETCLFEIEACINSRPLTFVGDTIESLNPLTPSHFLIGRGATYEPTLVKPTEITPSYLRERFALMEQRLDLFWLRWSQEYLRNLPASVRGSKPVGQVKLGSVVLLREDHIPRLKWPLGLVSELFPGSDGVVRSVKVKTDRGVYVRSIQRLHDLEIVLNKDLDCFNESVGQQDLEVPESAAVESFNHPAGDGESGDYNDKSVRTRSGRVVKPKVLFSIWDLVWLYCYQWLLYVTYNYVL